MTKFDTDVAIIGGGPAGACSALYLAQRGIRSCILEKERFPRFHVGESLLPSLSPYLEELGLTEPLSKITQVPKYGAELALAWQEEGTQLSFSEGRPWGLDKTFNAERAAFDKAILDHAACHELIEVKQTEVTAIHRLRDNDCALSTGEGPLSARLVLDASGQATVLGRHLGSKAIMPDHRKVAFMGHFTGVDRLPGEASGYISIVMANDAWFWMIPIDDQRTSIGMVMDKKSISLMRKQGVKPGQELAWAIPRTPFIAKRTEHAAFPETNGCVSDFSYRCSPGADEGYLMVGDAEAFLDPVFSSGLYLAVAGARDAAEAVADLLNDRRPADARQTYLDRVAARRTFFFTYINLFYSHAFREFLTQGTGPLSLHRALIAVLSGRCERLPLSMRWRLSALHLLHRLQRRKPSIIEPRVGWSVLEAAEVSRQQSVGR
ncbi:MAG: NAD(P)/FAD-dependent oxidoreductase [Phycisphaeraceae bacterium]